MKPWRSFFGRSFLVSFLFFPLLFLPTGNSYAVDGEALEVENLHFINEFDFEWDPPFVAPDFYNVYRTLGSALPADYGSCFQLGLPTPNAADLANPPLGDAFVYFPTAVKATLEGIKGFDSSPAVRPNLTPCIAGLTPPAPINDLIYPNGPQPDGVVQGTAPARNPAVANDLNGLAGGQVFLHTGEYFYQKVDMEIPGRGLNWRHVRTYRSQVKHDGAQGRGWTFNYDRRVVAAGPNLLYLDGEGRMDEFAPVGGGRYEPVEPGIYSKIRVDATTITRRDRDGTLYVHFPLDGSAIEGSLRGIIDRLDNRMSFIYHSSGALSNIVDTLGRTIHYFWNPDGRLESVVDYNGREVRYTYDPDGHLIESRSPVVIGTPIGNDFPLGKTTLYTYDTASPDPLFSNLLTITAPGDPMPVVQNLYNTDDELQFQDHGGINASGIPAGGAYAYAITPLGGGDRQIVVTDRRGQDHHFFTLPSGQIEVETDPIGNSTGHFYSPEGERTETTRPLGNEVLYVYDSFNPDLFQRGNLLEVRRVADAARGDGFGGALADVIVTYEYEPLYTQQRIITDPNGRASSYIYDYQEGDPAINGVNGLLFDWDINIGATLLFIGDVNGDGITAQASGNPIVLRQPDVNTIPGGRQDGINGPLQEVRSKFRYNDLGQLVVEVDAEKNVKVHHYHPEIDPDGDGISTPPPLDGRTLGNVTGGYLRDVTLDADPTPYLSAAEIGSRNNATTPIPTEIVNLHLYSPVGNLVESVDGEGTITRYDLNELGQIVQVTRDAAGFAHLSQQFYNERDEIVQRRVQDSSLPDGFMDVFTTYDILGNVVMLEQEVQSGIFALTEYRYDGNENRTSVRFPENNIFTLEYGPRGLLARLVRDDDDLDASNGGPPGSSQQFFTYDANGNPDEFTDGNLTAWPFLYDGMDRRVQAHIVPGLVAYTTRYNPDESIAFRFIHDAAITYHQTFFGYDELGRPRSVSQLLLDASGVPLPESSDGDEFATILHEYDRNSRRSRVTNDEGRIVDYDYDGAGRVVRKEDAAGSQITYEYDDNNNLLRTEEIESTPVGTETFETNYEYDSLNRLSRTINHVGQDRLLDYDDRSNLIGSTDRLGNTISYTYDAVGRRTSIVRDLRVGGIGSGAVFDQVIYGFDYDLNGRAVVMTDPEGNTTQYTYDGLNRKIIDTFDDGTQIKYTYDANDNVVLVEDANGSITTINYDQVDRPTGRVVAPAAGIPPTVQTFDYDSFNRLIYASDQTGAAAVTSVNREYDSYNRLRLESTQFGGNPVRTLEYTYDGVGNRITADYPTNGVPNTITYSYDPLDRLISTADTQTGFSTGYSYLGPERVAERFHGNGTRLSYLDPTGVNDIGYDGVKRVRALRHYDGLATQTGFDYTHDEESNPTSEVRLHDAGLGDVWVYDSAYRLVDYKRDVDDPVAEAQVPGTGGAIQRRTQYSLDRVGNWIERTIDDYVTSTFGTFGNTPSNLNEYGEKPDDGLPDDFNDDLGTAPADGTNLGHDPGGDMVTEGARTYLYDALHRLVEVREGGSIVAKYSYDGLDRRISKKVYLGLGSGTRYVHDGDRTITELDLPSLPGVCDTAATVCTAPPPSVGNSCAVDADCTFVGDTEGAITRRYFWGSEDLPIALHDEPVGALYYLHEDARGNVRAATDASGGVVERITYGAYGTPEFRDPTNVPTGLSESLIGNPFLYLGQHWDPETELYEQHAAMFAPRYGRHLQRYLPGQHSGPLGMAFNPPVLLPNLLDWIGMNPFWWCKSWFWNPGAWWGGWWSWRAGWWWGGPWRWWSWRPWLWFGTTYYGWWWLRPWAFWWGGPFNWWGWQAWWAWSDWWGWWPWWGWGGWSGWWPWFGWGGWWDWWPWWGWAGWYGWWPTFGWWGWHGWWPFWNTWWGWTPYWWWGWWSWSPWWWHGFWAWSGIGWLWNWWAWVYWWPWKWWFWFGWWGWWGWIGWNPWWWSGWWGWSIFSWATDHWWWWGPIGWWAWFGWNWWHPWWWWGWWPIFSWWHWWLFPWWTTVWFGWWNWWGWWGGLWHWPWWGWWRWWGAWWPWWGWWC